MKSFRIVKFSNPSGEAVWRVTGFKQDGARVRKNFQTQAEAVTFRQDCENESLGESKPLMQRSTALTGGQIVQAEAAYIKLRGRDLLEAVDYFLTHVPASVTTKTIADALTEFLADRTQSKSRPATLVKLKDRVGLFSRKHPAATVSSITTAQVKEFIFRPGSGAWNQDTDRRVLHSFFEWCIAQKFCGQNPVKAVASVKADRHEVKILALDEVANLVKAAKKQHDGEFLPYVALGLFCAIRPTELARLTWGAINLDAATVIIGSEIAKMRRRRIVEIPAAALALLKTVNNKDAHAPIARVDTGWRRRFYTVKRAAGYNGKDADGLKAWPQDVMRHTGISYHLGLHRHEGLTAEWSGNSPMIIQRHYRALVLQPDVARFWATR